MGLLVAVALVSFQTAAPAPSSPPVQHSGGQPSRMDPNVYYVDPILGRDVGNGRNPQQPWRTLTHALPRAGGAPGVVVMAPGEYSEASGEQFPLRPQRYMGLYGEFAHGARIVGPRGGNVPVFVLDSAGFQSFTQMEIVTEGVAFDITFSHNVSGRVQGWPALDISAEIKARRALDVHLQSRDYGGYLGVSGTLHCDEAAITLDGTWSGSQSYGFELHLGGAVLSAGTNAAVVDVRVGGGGRVGVFGRNSALYASGAGIWLRPSDALDLSVGLDSCVFHGLGNASFGGGPLVVEGAGARALEIRRSIFSGNHGDIDLPNYDSATYVLEQNLVQQASLVGVGGNVTGDPRFVDGPSGDFHLRPDSAARGVGLTATLTYDHEGDPRGSSPDDATTDLGLDEFYPRYHWFHPRPRVGKPTLLRILGQPGDLAMAFASRGRNSWVFGSGWQLGELISPLPFAVALIGPDGLAEIPVSLPRALTDGRLRGPAVMTQIRYLTPQGATEYSANAAVVHLTR